MKSYRYKKIYHDVNFTTKNKNNPIFLLNFSILLRRKEK